jgi:hypothetical protein
VPPLTIKDLQSNDEIALSGSKSDARVVSTGAGVEWHFESQSCMPHRLLTNVLSNVLDSATHAKMTELIRQFLTEVDRTGGGKVAQRKWLNAALESGKHIVHVVPSISREVTQL